AAAWRSLSGRPVIVTPAEPASSVVRNSLVCQIALRYGARALVLEAAHFAGYDSIYNGDVRPSWLGPPTVRDTIKIFPIYADSVGEWLGEILLYVAYLAGGWTGLVILRGLLVAVAAFFLTRVALRGGAPVIVAVPVSCAALLLSEIVWTDRPHLFTLALFPLLLDLLFTARAGRIGVLLGAPPLLLVWTNLHGGYALGLALVGIFTLDALLERPNCV